MKEIENFYYNKRIVSNSLIKAKNSVDSLSESSSVSCKLKKNLLSINGMRALEEAY